MSNPEVESEFTWARIDADFTALTEEDLRDLVTNRGGEWSLIEGPGGRVLAHVNSDRRSDSESASDAECRGSLLLFRGQRFGDLVAACSVLFPRGGDGAAAGVVYRVRDGDNNYLCCELDSRTQTIRFVEVQGQETRVLASGPVDISADKWLYVYLRHINPFHSVWINGELALTMEHRVSGAWHQENGDYGLAGINSRVPKGTYFASFGASEILYED